jgi:hypothetical protein
MLLLGTTGFADVIVYLPTIIHVTSCNDVLVVANKPVQKENFCPTAM